MMTREEAAAIGVATVRLEGLDPGEAGPLLQRWARGELTDEQLDQAYERLIADEPIDAFLADSIDRSL